MMESRHKISYNVLGTILISIICFYLYHQSGVMDNAGMAAIILNWIPFMVGIFTLMIYFITRAIKKEYAWIITLLGGLFNIAIVVSAFMSEL